MCAKTSPTRTWTRSLSTSFCSLVSATLGWPWLSSTITSTLRPVIVWLFSSSHIAIPFVMSLPIWAAPPDIGAITPILIGPFCAHDESGAQRRAEQRPAAAQRDHQENLDRGGELEVRRADEAVVVGPQDAGE